jgi:hypothetical protein
VLPGTNGCGVDAVAYIAEILRAAMEPIVLTLVTRHDCHLCEEMRAVVDAVRTDEGLEVRDVDADEALRAAYGAEVPVLLINGRKAFKYRVTPAALRRRLRAERARLTRRGWRRMRPW